MRRQNLSHENRPRLRRSLLGFTLIEVLVVVAIIALLISILLPSLQRAREQARITTCKANCKQIANAVSMYQAEYRGYVPTMFNYAANGWPTFAPAPPPGVATAAPARTCWLSVALRAYDKATARMKQSGYDPEQNWNDTQRQAYEDHVMPEYYVCPFARGKGPGKVLKATDIPVGTATFADWIWQGRHELYQTWKWDGLTVKNERPTNGAGVLPLFPADDGSPNLSVDGRPKYSALCWNQIKSQDYAQYRPYYSGFTRPATDWTTINLYRQWTARDAQRVKAASLSDVTIIFCAQGMHLDRTPGFVNRDSHRTGQGGGTNVIFADTHVEWVKGTRVGWP